MPPRSFFLAAFAVLSGCAGAAFTVDLDGVRAESPLEFFTRRSRPPPSYAREPVYVERRRRGGLLDGFFEFFGDRPPPPRREAPGLQRVICKRQCDGAQLALGFLPAKNRQKDAEAMCAAAGGGEKTHLVVEKFEPGAGFAVPEPVRTASAAPLIEGRAALDAGASAHEPCAAGTQPFMTVPILNDATLRKGDVVATRDGFKLFVGSGRPPFEAKDFVDVDRRRVSADVKRLRAGGR